MRTTACGSAGHAGAGSRRGAARVGRHHGVSRHHPDARESRDRAGFAFGFGLLVIGFEFEYANAVEDAGRIAALAADRIRQRAAPDAGRDLRRCSSTARPAAAVYRERSGPRQETHFAHQRRRRREDPARRAAAPAARLPRLPAAGRSAAHRPISASTPAPIWRSDRASQARLRSGSAAGSLPAELLGSAEAFRRGVPGFVGGGGARATCSSGLGTGATDMCANSTQPQLARRARRTHRGTSPAAPAARPPAACRASSDGR